MENNTKHPLRESPQKENSNGQRISVRPGNFNPPGEAKPSAPATPTGKGEQGEQHKHHGGHNRNRRNRHRGGERRPQQNAQQSERQAQGAPTQQPQKQAQAQKKHPQQPQKQNQQQEKQQNSPSQKQNQQQQHAQGGKNRRNGRRRGGRDERAQQPQEAALSPTLLRELEEDFSTPTLSAFSGSPLTESKKQKQENAVETEEFAVDIATASYLVEDVPCGFPVPDGKAVEVVGARFRHAGRVYFFAPGDFKFNIGDGVIVDTARGLEFADIVILNRKIAEKDIIQPLRSVIRPATKEDIAHDAENRVKEAEALKVCATKIAVHKLDMRLVDAQYTFDNSKLIFYFTSEGRVDFRELVRDLAAHFHTRIELRQIGIRDEARLIGGLGLCGRPFCCTTFLSDFGQVSVKMAKEQGLSINTSKISGCCGRLMCCLRYEQDTYVEEAKLTPHKNALVNTPDGRGVVVDSTPLAGTVKVKLDDAPEEAPKVYHRDEVEILSRRELPKEDAQTQE